MFSDLSKFVVKVIEALSILGVVLMLLFTAYEVFVREILAKPTIWTNEVTSYMLVWFGMLSVVYAYTQKAMSA